MSTTDHAKKEGERGKEKNKYKTTIHYSITRHSVFSFNVYYALKIETTLRSDAFMDIFSST